MTMPVLHAISGMLALAQAAVAAPPSACLGLEAVKPGTSWTYAGWRQWSAEGSAQPDSAPVRWTTTVEATRAVPAGRLLLVRGFVFELAWSVPSTRPRLSILACRQGGLLRLAFVADSAARYRFDHWTDDAAKRGEVILQQPLSDGAVFGQDPPRQDDMYGWVVEALKPSPAIPPGCGRPGPDAYRLTMRTMPDHQVVDWRAGLGIIAYSYAHHGTPAAAEVRLVACRGR